ncbi:MAG: Hsp20/alpha crystallin family protein [Planctomycetes bacterium]|nr:Hsp20/alpha crystallin family protein [Planctomycetota bacterium]
MFSIRHLSPWNPWEELERFHAEFERGAQSLGSALQGPSIDVWSEGDDLRLRALLPGVRPEDLEVTVEGDQLTLRGTIESAGAPSEGRWIRRERMGGSFQRTLQLPFAIEADAVKARLVHGVLELELPRAAAEKPRKIQVQATT